MFVIGARQIRECLDAPLDSKPTFYSLGSERVLIAANDRYGLVFAVTRANRHGLLEAARRTDNRYRRRIRWTGDRRASMCPIPGNVIGAGVYPLRYRLPDVYIGLAIEWRPEEASDCRKESPKVSSVVMMTKKSVVMRRSVVMPRMH